MNPTRHVVNKTWDQFRKDPLCRPGVRIVVAQANERGGTSLIIGDINVLGGECDDCRGIAYDDLVLEAEDLLEGRNEK